MITTGRSATSNVAALSAPGFANTVNVTVPLVAPLAPDTIEIHGTSLEAVHEQPCGDDTLIVRVPPDTGIESLIGVTEKLHVGPTCAAPCMTLAVCLAMVSVPVRAVSPLLPTVNVTDPLPVPLAPPVTVIQGALLTALQGQPAAVDTMIGVPGPPDVLAD